MSKFVRVGKAFVNLDLAQWIYLEEVPKKHYADEPNFGSIIFKSGETTYIRDEASLNRVKTVMFQHELSDEINKLLTTPTGVGDD